MCGGAGGGMFEGGRPESNTPLLLPSQAYLQQAQDLVILESIILQTLGELGLESDVSTHSSVSICVQKLLGLKQSLFRHPALDIELITHSHTLPMMVGSYMCSHSCTGAD